MRKDCRLPLYLLAAMLFQLTLTAQQTSVIDWQGEQAFAISEYDATTPRPGFSTVAHLDPTAVANSMSNPNYISGTTKFTFVIAHRGSHSLPGCAENSACGIAAAYAAGADGVELDIKTSGTDPSTNTNESILGHDYTLAREVNNWVDNNGNPVTRSSAWTPFSSFPVVDSVYQDMTKFPFLLNYTGKSDPNNPTRASLPVQNLQKGVLIDTYDQTTSNRQLTLYEALFLVSNYYPMMIWLDVKSNNDLANIANAITVARAHPGANAAVLNNIGLKMTWSSLSTLSVPFNPGAVMGLSGIKYFMVFGTGDLDGMATYNLTPPASPSQANANITSNFQKYCAPSVGCLGAELNHKDPNGPTLGIFNSIQDQNARSFAVQLASFATIPQYAWYWMENSAGNPRLQVATQGRSFPRTDGSCCFALLDALNSSAYLKSSEATDLRNLYSWNENNFTTITTDEPLLTMRDLYNLNRRQVNVAQMIGGTNTSTPSGGPPSQIGPIRDGLYTITNGTGYNLSSVAPPPYVGAVQPAQTLSQYWYVASSVSIDNLPSYTLINAASGLSLEDTNNNNCANNCYPAVGRYTVSPPFQMTISGSASSAQISASITSNFLSMQGTNTLTFNGQGVRNWTLAPVAEPSAERTMQQVGPAGYSLCAEENGTCSPGVPSQIAFGIAGYFIFLDNVSSTPCTVNAFGLDPAPNIAKACFYVPYVPSSTLSTLYSGSNAVPEGSTISGGSWAYGASDSNGAHYTFTWFPSSVTCNASTFLIDPAPGLTKSCYKLISPFSQAIPAGFVPCALQGEYCAAKGSGTVAFGTSSTSSPGFLLTYKATGDSVLCDKTTFGVDPAPGSSKFCYFRADLSFSTENWQTCAANGGSCTVPLGSRMVAVKVSGTAVNLFTTATFANTSQQNGSNAVFKCTAANFFPGTTYSSGGDCYYYAQWSTLRGPAGYAFCAAEGALCRFAGTANIAFGIDGKFNYLPGTTGDPVNGFTCANNASVGGGKSLGNDPYVNVPKACYYRLY